MNLRPAGPVESRIAVRLMLSLNGLAILLLGIFPGVLLRICEHVLP